MDKASLNIPAVDGKWGSYISKYPPDSAAVGNSAFTEGTRNLITSASGQAEKRQGGIIWNPASLLSGPALDQFEGVFSTGQRLFIVNDAGTLKASTGNGIFAALVGGTGFTNPANFEFVTYQNRVYACNGVDAPIVIDVATSYGGATYTAAPAKVRPMGATAPASAPTSGAPSAGGAVPAGAHTYKVTYLYYNGAEESNGSAASAVQTAGGGNLTIGLSAIPVGGYGVTGRKVYRDNNDGNYLLLTSILDNTTTTFSDTLAIGATPTPMPQLNFGPPLYRYSLLYLDRIFVIDITGRNIYWSLAGEPDVFYPANSLSGPPDDIMTGFGMLNGLPYVFGQHTVGTILGTTDSSFYYNSLSTAVGCVDNRTIQTRLIVSVPTLMWLAALPNRGIYYTNGSIIQHMSDNIQDLTFNLAQISYLSRLNSQASQADFEGGTSSPAIDLLSNPGTIQTINPKAQYSHAADWAAGTLSNLAVSGDQLSVPARFNPTLSQGTLGGSAQITGSNLTFPSAAAPVSYASAPNGGFKAIDGFTPDLWMPFVVTQTGIVSVIRLYSIGSQPSPVIVTDIRSSNLGIPDAFIDSLNGGSLAGTGSDYYDLSFPSTGRAVLSAGNTYFIGIAAANVCSVERGNGFPGQTGSYSGSGFDTVPSSDIYASLITMVPTTATLSGTWLSPVKDSQSTTLSAGMSLALTATYPTHTSSSVLVQGTNNLAGAWTTTDTLASPTGSAALTGGTYRFWRVQTTIATTDNHDVPLVSAPVLAFNTTGTWTSAPILLTTDITSLDDLVVSAMAPAGTTASALIATSPLIGSGYTSFGAIGSATPDKYAKIKITLTTDAGNSVSPSLLSAELDWTVVATFISSIVDTGAIPSGWGIFEFGSLALPGTIASHFRTAASSGGIPAAVFAPVVNGAFPTNAVFEFFQYKLVMTASADAVPQANTVTTNWLLSSGANVRAASLFFNKSYFLAVATQGSPTNNLLIEYDYQDNWRIHDGVQIGTMATYFNDIFYCDALNGNIYNGFQSLTDNGTPIVMRLRTKCFDLGDNLRMKTVRSVKITGVNTGTLLSVLYSIDRGSTWNMMLNSLGTAAYLTASDLSEFIEYFVPVFDGTVPVSGRTVMFEIVSADEFACSILQISPTVYVHKGKAIREAMVR